MRVGNILSPNLTFSHIIVSPRTIKKHRQQLGLTSSRATMKKLDPTAAEQLVLDQMDRDPARHQGPRNIRHNIAMKTGIHLTRDFVTGTMHTHDPEGFTKRNPTAKRIHREPKVPLGINERWSADGHDKLNSIGFPLYALWMMRRDYGWVSGYYQVTSLAMLLHICTLRL